MRDCDELDRVEGAMRVKVGGLTPSSQKSGAFSLESVPRVLGPNRLYTQLKIEVMDCKSFNWVSFESRPRVTFPGGYFLSPGGVVDLQDGKVFRMKSA